MPWIWKQARYAFSVDITSFVSAFLGGVVEMLHFLNLWAFSIADQALPRHKTYTHICMGYLHSQP